MPTSIADFARAAADAARARVSFEARQSIRAGKIEVAAHVRFRAPDRAAIEFSVYTSPLAEIEDLLGSHAELAPNDLVGVSLAFDGRVTRYLNPKTATALVSPGRRLYEPIPGCDALAEVNFLDDLSHEYLLRDAGNTTCAGRAARTLGLKPKRRWVSSLFRTKAFLLERAEVTLDVETHFPLRIEFLPERGAPASSALGPDGRVTIEYANVRFGEIDEAAFAPTLPAGTSVFTEELAAPDAATGLPFPLPTSALAARGFRLADDRALVVLDASRERGYATVVFSRVSSAGRPDAALIVRTGNYISRLMARRRTMAAERGEAVDIAGQPARYADRRALLGPDLAEQALPLLADAVWEREGIFWVLSGEGLTKEELLAVASELF